jgi:hypothetical protein
VYVFGVVCFLQVTPEKHNACHIPCPFHSSLVVLQLMYIWRAASCFQFLIMQFTRVAFYHIRVRHRSDVFLSTPLSDTLSQCPSLTATQLSHPQSTTGTTEGLHVSIFICLKTTIGTTRRPAPNTAKQSHKFVRSYLQGC